MTPLLQKLNFKNQKEMLLLNPPNEFELEQKEISAFVILKNKLVQTEPIEFVLSFVKTKEEIENLGQSIIPLLKEDALLWFAFPKGSSKKYKVEINRDKGWEYLKEQGFETVRAVSIDEDWSALRFRHISFIKVMTRKF
ncbi:MAG: hypothetical protein K9I36_07305 [Bacteroidia bacterium]|nr:hypothetical protein [Bacteroidia bacterium]MCF8426522.1 hypothetical protein [Bacteroidia bacterium]